MTRLSPARSVSAPSRRTVIWIDAKGKAGLYEADGSLRPSVRRLLDGGADVVGVDLLSQGEFLVDGSALERQRWLDGEEGFAGWTYCYNLPLFARRVEDILAVIAWNGAAWANDDENRTQPRIDLVGQNGAGAWVAAAAAQARGAIDRVAIDTGGFRFGAVSDVYGVDFLPGALKYGDLPALLALAAPTRLWLAGEGETVPAVTLAAYRAAEAQNNLTVASEASADRIVDWLLEDHWRR